MTFFVTGASGFVGSYVVRQLTQEGHKVVSLVRNPGSVQTNPRLIGSDLQQFDIDDVNNHIQFTGDDLLIHCAWANVRDTLSQEHISSHLRIQYDFLERCICNGLRRLVVTGSCYEFGLTYGPVKANDQTRPNTPYALAKDFLHKGLRHLQLIYNFDLIWARLFYLYGEGQSPKSVIGLFDAAVKRNDLTFDMSYGEQLLDLLPVEEATRQLVKLCSASDGTYHIYNGSPVSLRRFLEDRIKQQNSNITLNLGRYEYRAQDSMAIWGSKD